MKKLLIITLLSGLLYSCADTKQQEKQLYQEVIALHDSVMAENGVLMKNKMKLDTILSEALPLPAKDSALQASKSLSTADEAMNTWMHQFEPDYTGKPHAEVMKYLQQQKTQITKVDSLSKAAISLSNAFLSNHKN
ncbi:MAG: hypothetical protein EOP47_21115 [Sphingobacteriaceae bacterium]|nr:MAG: hypothetical protein EOP47_21115 [Sphingobacteriaceae bacterium]